MDRRKYEKKAEKNGFLKCPQCRRGIMKEFEFDDTGIPIYLSPCKMCGYE